MAEDGRLTFTGAVLRITHRGDGRPTLTLRRDAFSTR